MTDNELAELITSIRSNHCRSYVDAAKVLAEEASELIEKIREQKRRILQLEKDLHCADELLRKQNLQLTGMGD